MPDRAKPQAHLLGRPQSAVFRFPAELRDACREELLAVIESPSVPEKFRPTVTMEGAELKITDASFRLLLELTYRVRLFRDILLIVGTGRVGSVAELKARVRKAPWQSLLEAETLIKIRTLSSSSRLNHEGLVEATVKSELIARGFRIATGSTYQQLLDVRLIRNQLQLSLSLAGEPLGHRHYKKVMAAAAPLKEDLAAGLTYACVRWVGDYRPDAVYVPFAGSGTLGFEALLLFQGLAPALFRDHYAIDDFLCTPADTRKHLLNRFRRTARKEPLKVYFLEKSAAISSTLSENCAAFLSALQSSLGHRPAEFEVKTGDFFEAAPPCKGAKELFLPLNPPYGDRLKANSRSTESLYSRIGEKLSDLQGRLGRARLTGFLLAPNRSTAAAAERSLGSLRTERRQIVHGGRKIQAIFFTSRINEPEI